MNRYFLCAAVLFCGLFQITSAVPIPLKLTKFSGPDPSFKEEGGVVEIHGAMPVLATPATAPGKADTVLELEYFCVGGVSEFAALPGPPFEAKTARMLPEMGHSEAWTTYTARLAPVGKPLPDEWREVRFDFPLPSDRTLQIRNARIRPELKGEFAEIDSRPDAAAAPEALESYLVKDFPAKVTRVQVGKDTIRIEGSLGEETGPFLLADIPMDIVLDDRRSWETLVEIQPDAAGKFRIDVPRTRKRGELDYDRLTSRWQLVRRAKIGFDRLSHAHYADSVFCRSPKLPAAKPKNKKGLGGWNLGRLPKELDDLGISAVTVNLPVEQFISLKADKNTVPVKWQGRTWYIRENRMRGYDASFREAAKHDIMVSAILLVANPAKSADPKVKTIAHPDAVKEGIFGMPNVTSEEGIAMYGAVLNFISERWSRPDGKYGRVHHWIVHNEVDAGWVWTNVGDKPAVVYMDLYQRSMRLSWLIAAQYDPNSRPFISLTHHWAYHGSAHWYGSKQMLELLVKFCQAEGDFPWAVAYHPYPQDLRNPRAWENDQATFGFDSKKITPKNLEVLDAYMKTPAMLYDGRVRPVHFSENGFNSPDYSEKSLEDQAAGMAMAWKKIQNLSSVESWQYHNWIDNRNEGGLRIGLRKFPDEQGDPLGKKPIWFLYQALGTSAEDRVAAPYLKTIGIKSWDDVIHKGEIH